VQVTLQYTAEQTVEPVVETGRVTHLQNAVKIVYVL
jgi:hypothetical protein